RLARGQPGEDPEQGPQTGIGTGEPALDLFQFPLLAGGQAQRGLTTNPSLSVSVRLGYRP
ncbi:MAG: hypothetical protein ACTHPS_30200, partial [Streptosporangiaceae bacterium]